MALLPSSWGRMEPAPCISQTWGAAPGRGEQLLPAGATQARDETNPLPRERLICALPSSIMSLQCFGQSCSAQVFLLPLLERGRHWSIFHTQTLLTMLHAESLQAVLVQHLWLPPVSLQSLALLILLNQSYMCGGKTLNSVLQSGSSKQPPRIKTQLA